MTLKDPVCGMTVTDKSFHHMEQGGRRVYFCGDRCKDRFARHTAAYPGTEPPRVLPTGELHLSRKIQLRWWLLLIAGLMSLSVVYYQLA
jgi:YHS domain-containing protein